jgi:hypothetical protein
VNSIGDMSRTPNHSITRLDRTSTIAPVSCRDRADGCN